MSTTTTQSLADFAKNTEIPFNYLLSLATQPRTVNNRSAFPAQLVAGSGWQVDTAAATQWLANNPVTKSGTDIINAMTLAEYTAIKTAAQTALAAGDASLEFQLDKITAGSVTVTDSDYKTFVETLVAKSAITQDRATVVFYPATFSGSARPPRPRNPVL